jgi:uncharacterized protein
MMKTLDIFVTALLLIGALNWGLVGFFGFNLVSAIFGEVSVLGRVIYAFIGLGALYEIGSLTFGLRETQHRWCETLASVRH